MKRIIMTSVKQSALLLGMMFSIVGCSQENMEPPVDYVMSEQKREIENSEISTEMTVEGSQEVKEETTQGIENGTSYLRADIATSCIYYGN